MKKFKKLSFGIILLNVFLFSTIVMILIRLFGMMPDNTRTLVTVWMIEFFVVIGYVLFFYNSGKTHRSNRKHISVARH